MNNSKIPFFTKPYTYIVARDIPPEIEKLRAEITDDVGNRGDAAYATPSVIRKQTDILYLISRLNEISTARLSRQTDTLIALTRWIVTLTVALFLLTVYLCYKEYHAGHHPNFSDERTPKQ